MTWLAVLLLALVAAVQAPMALAGGNRWASIPGLPTTTQVFARAATLLDRFGVGSPRDWLALMAEVGLLPEGYSIVESKFLEHLDEAGVISQPQPLLLRQSPRGMRPDGVSAGFCKSV